jgi:hypothetical protein
MAEEFTWRGEPIGCGGVHRVHRDGEGFYLLLVRGYEDDPPALKDAFTRRFDTMTEAMSYLLGVEDSYQGDDYRVTAVGKDEYDEVVTEGGEHDGT